MSDLAQLSTKELESMLAAAKSKQTAPTGGRSQPVTAITNEFESADTTTGADFMTRLGASFKMTPEGKVNYLRHRYGPQNVALDEKGNVFFRPKDGGRLTLFDEKDVSLSDLADFAGDVPGVVLSALGATAGGMTTGGPGSVPGAAAGAAAGNAIKQAFGAMIPGDENMTPLSRVGSMATDAAMGAGTQFGVNKLMSLRDLTRPKNLLARSAQNAQATPQAVEGRALVQDTGIPMTFAQETGDRTSAALEGMARRSPVAADDFAKFDQLQTGKAVERIKSIMDDIHRDEVGDVSLGQSVQRAFDKVWDNVVAQRRTQAAKDFAEVTKLGGKEALIPVQATKQRLLDLAKEFDVPGGGDASAALAKQIKAAASDFGMMVSPDQMNRLLQIYGKAMAGKGTIFKDLDTAQQRYLAGQVHKALTADLDTAAANPLLGKASEALKVARDNYAANSAKISEVGDSVVGRYFGNVGYERTPERVADTISKMKPTEIRATLGILTRADPEIADKTARHFLERALDASKPAVTQSAGGQVKFSAAKFLNALPDENVQVALFGGKPAMGELKKVANVLERVADQPMAGSPTAPMLMAWDMAKGLFTLNPRAIAGLPAAVLAPKAIARAALTPQGRQALITVATTEKPTKVALGAISYLTAMNVREANQDVDAAIAAAGAK